MRSIQFVKGIYSKYIAERGKEIPFLAFLFFLLAVLISRLTVIWIEAGRPFLKIFVVRDYHIHHFYLGILLLVLSNWLFLVRKVAGYLREVRIVGSILFGIGLGLIIDEFGLLLTMEFDLTGDYWAPQSYYLMALLSAVFILILVFKREYK